VKAVAVAFLVCHSEGNLQLQLQLPFLFVILSAAKNLLLAREARARSYPMSSPSHP
jgi:hypothetical protein